MKQPTLQLTPKITLPAYEAITKKIAILANTGAGKTYTASVMVEEFLKANLPVVIIDPIGAWWGLKSSADGQRQGFPIYVFGGDQADVPLLPSAGEVMANVVVEEQVSMILDLSNFANYEMAHFVTDFLEALYTKNRTPLMLVMEEADMFAPQRPQPGEQRMLGAAEKVVRRGRQRGIGVTMITQRPAVLNKNVLTQADLLIALRMTYPTDREALDAWIKAHGTAEERQEFLTSLASLPIGQAWFWSPGWLNIFCQSKVRPRETFDSSATPQVGAELVKPKVMASVDLTRIRQKIAATVEAAIASDPKALKRLLDEANAKLRAKTTASPKTMVKEVVKVVEKPIFPLAEIKRLNKIMAVLDKLANEISHEAQQLRDSLELHAPSDDRELAMVIPAIKAKLDRAEATVTAKQKIYVQRIFAIAWTTPFTIAEMMDIWGTASSDTKARITAAARALKYQGLLIEGEDGRFQVNSAEIERLKRLQHAAGVAS